MLAGMIFFVRSNELPPIKEDRYKWWDFLSFDRRDPMEDIRVSAITIIRNSIAHWGENGSGIEFVTGATQFSSRAGKLVLEDKGLHLYYYANVWIFTAHSKKSQSSALIAPLLLQVV